MQKTVRNKIHGGVYDEDEMKVASTLVEMFEKVRKDLFVQNIQNKYRKSSKFSLVQKYQAICKQFYNVDWFFIS